MIQQADTIEARESTITQQQQQTGERLAQGSSTQVDKNIILKKSKVGTQNPIPPVFKQPGHLQEGIIARMADTPILSPSQGGRQQMNTRHIQMNTV